MAFCPVIAVGGSGYGFRATGLAVAYYVLGGLVHQLTLRNVLISGTLIAAFGGVGVVMAIRQPRNRIG